VIIWFVGFFFFVVSLTGWLV